MPGKVQLEKAAWQWVESVKAVDDVTDDHVTMAYRFNLKPCTTGQCRRNCKGNPFCLNNLGEKTWYRDLDESQWNDFNPEAERREEGKFVGLKNLGATCYVNTFLQLWFHNPAVKQALYRWRDWDLPMHADADWKPSSICGHLQLLFGLMQFSKKSYIDPTPLIESLGLDTKEQQDAQEFSKLFLSKLGEALTQGPNPGPSNIVQEQFAGSYCYVTRCHKCSSESSRESTFYELDINIQGQSTLMAALQEFLKEEKLEGENQYMCDVCMSKQNAVRSIQLRSLPPVLNLQLLRFVFDVKKGCKKKLKSYLQFPDVLDMSQFLDQPVMTCVYDLTAVLIHRGPSAHSGHYIAHIQDTVSRLWFRFNDEDITAMKGRRLELGKEEDVMAADLPELDGGSAPPKAPRTGKGQHSSRDAYMLVYTRRETDPAGKGDQPMAEEKDASIDLPPAVMSYIERDNATFENWIEEIALTRDANIFSGKEKQKQMQSLFASLQCISAEDDMEWLPLDWLTSWLADPDKPQPIICTPYLCCHNRLHPDNVVKMKIVRTLGAVKLFEEYGGDLHLPGKASLCMDCVRQRCSEMHYREQITEHSRFLNAELKKNVDTDQQCYWVGKTSLRCWKQYALSQIEASNGTTTAGTDTEDSGEMEAGGDGEGVLKMVAEEENGDSDSKDVKDDSIDPNDPDSVTSLDEAFNSEILCEPHGALHPDESDRRLVSEAVWKRLRCLFPSCPQFPKDHPVCNQCQKNLEEEQAVRQENRQRCAHHRELFQDLYLGRNRPRLKQMTAGSHVFVVHSVFISAWRKLLKAREGGDTEPLTEIVNRPLLCEHGKLLYPIDLESCETSEDISLLWDKEWQGLREFYACDVPIEILVAQSEGGQLYFISIPEVCSGCVAQRLQAEEEDLFKFEDETIFVRKVIETLVRPALIAEPPPASKYDEDPDFVETKAKRLRVDEGGVRKSQRHRRQRGEKEMKVSSSMTLKEFKTKVMMAFGIATFDQNLSIDGRPVSSNEANLGQLRFYPGCVVVVKADEPTQEAVADIDNSPVRKPEEGFKGTNLMSS